MSAASAYADAPPANGHASPDLGAAATARGPRRVDDLTDAVLVRQAQRGDAKALEALLRWHWKMLLGQARRHCGGCHLTEDLCQETCLKAIAHLGALRQPAAIQAWFHQFLAHEIHHCRRNNCRNICTPTVRTGTYIIESECVSPGDHCAADWEHLWNLLWRQANRQDGRQPRVAAFMLEYYARHERFPAVRVIARATRTSIPTANRRRTSTLLTWQRTLRASGHYP